MAERPLVDAWQPWMAAVCSVSGRRMLPGVSPQCRTARMEPTLGIPKSASKRISAPRSNRTGSPASTEQRLRPRSRGKREPSLRRCKTAGEEQSGRLGWRRAEAVAPLAEGQLSDFHEPVAGTSPALPAARAPACLARGATYPFQTPRFPPFRVPERYFLKRERDRYRLTATVLRVVPSILAMSARL